MAEVIIMPKLGFNMSEGKLVKWHKGEGEFVFKGEVLFEINTDKTAMPVEATLDGVVLKILAQEGEKTPVFEPIAIIGKEGEDITEIVKEIGIQAVSPNEFKKENESRENAWRIKEEDLSYREPIRFTPRARKYMKEEGIDSVCIKDIQGTGFEGGITQRDVKASPLAKKLVEKLGVDLMKISGSGAQGKIMRKDVENLWMKQDSEKKVSRTLAYEGVRNIIGERLAQSKFTAPHVYFTNFVNMTRFDDFKKKIKTQTKSPITTNFLIAYAVSRALIKYPALNASLVGDIIEEYEDINIGLAVGGEQGLIVPVIKKLQQKTLSQGAEEAKDLVERAIKGALLPEEYTEGTFTVSNLGMYDIDNFTAIINPSELAILAVSSIIKKPVVVTDEEGRDTICIHPLMNIQLTVDHRIIDGLLAAKFLKEIKDLLENPLRIVL